MFMREKAAFAFKDTVRAMLPKRYLLRRDVRKELRRGEPELKVASCLCSRSEISIDVGANLGIYSYLFSQHSGCVIAVEPHPHLAARLQRLLPASVRVFNCAASNQNGVSELHIPTLGGNELHSRSSLESNVNRGMTNRKIRVETLRLDSLQLHGGSVAVVKIDVEGHELCVLQGLVGIIEHSRPTILVESEARHHANAPFDVFDFLFSWGYLGYFIHRGVLRLVSEFSVEKFQAPTDAKLVTQSRSHKYVNNFIFVHPARSSVLNDMRDVFARQALHVA